MDIYEIPSLNELIAFVTKNAKHFNELDVTVLQKYHNTTTEKWSGGKYFLHGTLPLLPDTPVTNQMIDDAKNIHEQRGMSYGVPYSSFESMSIASSIHSYNQFIAIIERYQIVYKLPIHDINL